MLLGGGGCGGGATGGVPSGKRTNGQEYKSKYENDHRMNNATFHRILYISMKEPNTAGPQSNTAIKNISISFICLIKKFKDNV
jgi:hypothetical protein